MYCSIERTFYSNFICLHFFVRAYNYINEANVNHIFFSRDQNKRDSVWTFGGGSRACIGTEFINRVVKVRYNENVAS